MSKEQGRKSILKKNKVTVIAILTVLLASTLIGLNSIEINNVRGHSSVATPYEIFSIWNNSEPTIDGQIDFDANDTTVEWGYAAIYNLYDSTNTINGKLLLQNSNTTLSIGFDGTDLQTSSLGTIYGASIYFDVDNNGILTALDKQVRVITNTTDSFTEYLSYNSLTSNWDIDEWDYVGSSLATTNIIADFDFSTSYYEDTNNHWQYEFEIPLSVISSSAGENLGIAFEIYEDQTVQSSGLTWPYVSSDLHKIRSQAEVYGDITFGEAITQSFEYVTEGNFKLKSSAFGYNNGTFLTSGDIDGNGDQEIIVSSNRSVIGDNNLLAIFDYKNGEYQKIWSSWETSHQSLITTRLLGLATYDFDGNGKDELFALGKGTTILRFSDWNTTSNDFEQSEVVFTNSYLLNGYLKIADINNDITPELVFGDQNGYVNALEYNDLSDSFSHDKRSPFRFDIGGSTYTNIHAIGIGNIDSDLVNELLYQAQITPDDAIGTTYLQIAQRTTAKFLDNSEDDLPSDSTSITIDKFGHTIIVGDVDNDLEQEIIIVGQEYLRIFENDTFTDPAPLIEFYLGDSTESPYMSGGAAIGDVNNDGKNELVFGANNGTLYISTITDIGASLTYTYNWSNDFGTSIGYHEGILIDDFDSDGLNEIVVGDNYGQMLIIGKGEAPTVNIVSPSNNYVSGVGTVSIEWSASDDLVAIHYFELYVDSSLSGRLGGAQRFSTVSLTQGTNEIMILAYDLSGLISNSSINVKFDVSAPQVTITSPSNYYSTDASSVIITYFQTDADGDFKNYTIYRNDTKVISTTDETYEVDLPNSGIWNITVIAIDDTDLEGRASIFVIRDNIAPVIDITSHSDGTAVKVTDLNLAWTASDSLTSVDYFDVYLDGGFYDTTTSNSMELILSVDKDYTIQVKAFDTLGNEGSETITIKRDTVNPTVYFDPLSLPSLPDGNFYTNEQFLSVSWNATDNINGAGISYTQITIDGLIFDTYTPSIESDLLDLGNDSIKEIFIQTVDEAGNVATDYFTVILDRTSPNVIITNPANNFTTGLNYVVISWDAIDSGVGIDNYILLKDGVIDIIIYNPEITYYQFSLPSNKTYELTVKATDILGYQSEHSINVTYDSTAPTVSIISPNTITSYTNETLVDLTWDTSNLDVDYYEVYVNGTYNGTYTNTENSATIDFGTVPIDQTNIYNVTILAVTTSNGNYTDFRWIIIDQINPTLGINAPINDEIVIVENLHIEWFGYDEESGIDYFVIKLDGISVTRSATSTSYIMDISNHNGFYNLTLKAIDNAGNTQTTSINIRISLTAPNFYTSLATTHLCNNLTTNFDLVISDPGLGVKSITIVADGNNTIFSEDYGTSYQYNPYSLQINLSGDDFLTGLENHNLTIAIKDRINRERSYKQYFILDVTNPIFLQAPIFDSEILNGGTYDVRLNSNEYNNHSISITIYEEHGLQTVNLTIIGESFELTREMIYDELVSTPTLHKYDLVIDISNLATGNYILRFDFVDMAGNANSESYNINVLAPLNPPSNSNVLYIILAIFVSIIVASLVAVAIRKPIQNIGWQKELIVVAYTLKSGLTALFVTYSPEMVTDEQLFGGAMRGIRGILEELMGAKSKFEVEVMEFGNRRLLIYQGLFGDAVLLVRKVKPIHQKLLRSFTDEFEEQFASTLDDDSHITLKEYHGAEKIVEKYFGERALFERISYQLYKAERDQLIKNFETETKAEDSVITSFYHEYVSNNAAYEKLTDNLKVIFADALIFAEEALTDLIANELKEAERKAKVALKSIELVRQSITNIHEFAEIFETIPRIADLVIKGVSMGQKGYTEELHKAIEVASQLFLSQIT